MYPNYYSNQVMIDALLQDHHQMVQREMERHRWARLTDPRTPLAARLAWYVITLLRVREAGMRHRAGERQDMTPEGTVAP